jgi:hypothetical protein
MGDPTTFGFLVQFLGAFVPIVVAAAAGFVGEKLRR